jgi:hypothetical protein
MKQSKKSLHLELPAEALTELRAFGICPEWFATTVCSNAVRDMLDDSEVLLSYLQEWHDTRIAAA